LKRRVPRFYRDSFYSFISFCGKERPNFPIVLFYLTLNYEQPGISFIGCFQFKRRKNERGRVTEMRSFLEKS
jgi:hypothetical protein